MPYTDSYNLTEYWEELLAVAPKKTPLEPVLEEGDELLTIETAFEAVSFSDPDYDAVVKAVNEAPEYLKVLTIDVTYNEITFKISETLGIRLAELSGAVSMQPFRKGVNNSCKVVFKRPTYGSTSLNFYAMYHYLMTTYFKSCFVDLKRNVKTESFRVLIDISKDLDTLLNTLKSDFEQRMYLGHNDRKIYPKELTQHVVDRSRSLLLNSRLSAANLTVEGVSEPLVKYYRYTRSRTGLSQIIPHNPEEVTNVELIAKEGNSINVHFHTLETQIKGKKKVEMGIGAFITKYCTITNNVGNTELLNKVIEDLSTSVHMYMNRLKITTEITEYVYFGYYHGNYTKIETGGELYNSCMRGAASSKVCHDYYTKFIEEGLLDFVVQKDFEGNVAGRVLVWKDVARNTVYVDRYYPGISTLKNSITDTVFELYKDKKIYSTGRDDLRTQFSSPSEILVIKCDFMLEYFKDTLFNDSSSLHRNHQDSIWYYGITGRTSVTNFGDTIYGSSIVTSKERAQAFGEVMLSGGMEIVTQSTNGTMVPYMDSFSRMIVIGDQCWLVHNKLLDRVRKGLEKVRFSLIHSEKENNKISYYDYIRKYGPAEAITAALQAKMKEILEQNKTIIINE